MTYIAKANNDCIVKIAVIPKLTMNDQPYSAFESASLNIECWNANDIKTTTSKVVTSLDKPSLFDFSVPEQCKLYHSLIYCLTELLYSSKDTSNLRSQSKSFG